MHLIVYDTVEESVFPVLGTLGCIYISMEHVAWSLQTVSERYSWKSSLHQVANITSSAQSNFRSQSLLHPMSCISPLLT